MAAPIKLPRLCENLEYAEAVDDLGFDGSAHKSRAAYHAEARRAPYASGNDTDENQSNVR